MASRRHELKEASFYATTELLKRERIFGHVDEPVRQDDGIIEALRAKDIGVSISKTDFLKRNRGVTNVVTEPRPALALDYARKALELCTGKVALFVPAFRMCRPDAKQLIDETPLVRVYIITRRLRHYRDYPMGWWVWEKGSYETPIIRWI
jgi:hypothetical protein